MIELKLKRKFELVTSLHVLEHIGLGRYGDSIDPEGHVRAFKKLASLVSSKGKLWISFQVHKSHKVLFNGQRIIDKVEPLLWAKDVGLTLYRFEYLNPQEKFIQLSTQGLEFFSPKAPTLGIYFFKKT